MPDIVHAAGGAEYTLGKIEAAIATAQAWRDEHVPLPKEWPELGVGMSHPAVLGASWELANFVWWTRSLEERVDREPAGRKSTPRLGLLPLLNPARQAREQVKQLLREYRRRTLADARALATYTAHVGALPNPGRATIERDGRIALPLPDQFRRAQLSAEFTFAEGRDLLRFARNVVDEITALIDALLDIMEADYRAILAERGRAQV